MTFSTLSADQIRQVAAWPETRSVWNNRTYKLLDDVANHMIHADRVVAGDGLRRPYDGTGVGVAVIDSGVDATHPDLPYGAKVKKNFYIAADPLSGDEPSVFVEGSRNTDTEVGHGTHVSSTIAGTGAASGGKYKGVAPGADIYMFRAGAGLNIFTWWAVRAFDWVIQNGPANNIRVVSNSWGGGDGDDYDPGRSGQHHHQGRLRPQHRRRLRSRQRRRPEHARQQLGLAVRHLRRRRRQELQEGVVLVDRPARRRHDPRRQRPLPADDHGARRRHHRRPLVDSAW